MSRKKSSFTSTPCIPKGVVLDMDGLMLNTEREEIKFYVKISKEMGWPTPQNICQKGIGIGDDDVEMLFKNEYGQEYPYKEIWDAVKKQFTIQADKDGIPHRPGLLMLLDKLDKLGIPMAVATSTHRLRAEWKLERGGIQNRFKVYVFGDEVENGKPAPDIFLLAADRLGEKPENCIGFEDSPAGLLGLAAAGMPSVFIKDLVEPPLEILKTVWQRCTDLEEAALLFG